MRRHWLHSCKLKQNANDGCNSWASLAGLVLSFIACFILLVIATLARINAKSYTQTDTRSRRMSTFAGLQNHRRRSSVKFEGGRHFCSKIMYEKLSKCPNFTWHLPEFLWDLPEKCPNFTWWKLPKNIFLELGGMCPLPPVSFDYGKRRGWPSRYRVLMYLTDCYQLTCRRFAGVSKWTTILDVRQREWCSRYSELCGEVHRRLVVQRLPSLQPQRSLPRRST